MPYSDKQCAVQGCENRFTPTNSRGKYCVPCGPLVRVKQERRSKTSLPNLPVDSEAFIFKGTKRHKDVISTLARRFGWRCWYCESVLTPDDAGIDHIVPRCDGGRNDIENLALACQMCNYAKRGGPLAVFLDWLERVRSGDTLYKIQEAN